jgi:tagatose-1,6-bisphosphate aldolase non-catalytic subunit AgaZ/GatZ
MDTKYQRPSVPSRLGIGPMSRNVVDAAIRLAYRYRRSVMIIASRSQVECEDFGRGYVERWSTEEFVNYIRSKDPAGLIKICRDHGGPWQHPNETSGNLNESQVMTHSLESLLCDIRYGIEVLHIDTSREADGPASFERAVDRLIKLYGECQEFAHACAQMVKFEVGLEEQSSGADDPKEFRIKLTHILESLAGESLQPPVFVVGQTGTKVVGTENRGQLVNDPSAVGTDISQLVQICWEHGLALKAHNVDYLPRYAIRELVQNGTDAVNIAPEFGVTETTAFLDLLEELQLTGPRDEFLTLAYNSGAWRKWFDGHDTTDLQRSIAAGHYVFASDVFRDIKQQADFACRGQMKTVDTVLAAALDNVMERYATEIWNTRNKESL